MPHRRPRRFEGGDVDYLASVSDLMSGLIFIFVIALTTFAISLREVQESLVNAEDLRRDLLTSLQATLKAQGVAVQVDLDNGILRLPEQILFPLGRAELTPEGHSAVRALGSSLAALLPCYTHAPEVPPDCDRFEPDRLDAILVEGHTDDLPLSATSRYRSNWELSAARAISTYEALAAGGGAGVLTALRNGQEQPIFSVSGYAEHRPVVGNRDEASRAQNRRIDLRFIMAAPKAELEERQR